MEIIKTVLELIGRIFLFVVTLVLYILLKVVGFIVEPILKAIDKMRGLR